jgi:ribosome-associated translation inhibitor RaiA
MIYQITSDNIDLSESMETLTKDKFERIEARVKHFPEDACFARVVLNSAPEEQFTVKVELEINGKKYFSDETDFSLESALVKTVEELLSMMEKDSIVQKRKHLEEKEKIEEVLTE